MGSNAKGKTVSANEQPDSDEIEVLDAEVDWMDGYLNDPSLRVRVDEIPDLSELRFEQDGKIWFAESGGYAKFFAWSGDGNDGGFSGRCFEITTEDGEDVTLKGPFSSRTGVVNQRGFGPVVSVSVTTEEEVMERGYTFKSAALTLDKAREALEHVEEDCHFERVEKFDSDEPYWVPVRDNGGSS
jgi:hypothetical protein